MVEEDDVTGAPNPMDDAAENLLDLRLDGGWTVVDKIKRDQNDTGGNFCAGYIVRNDDGREGFCKALNLARALHSVNPALLLEFLTKAYNFECDLLQKCANARMSRVVLAIDFGVVHVRGHNLPKVNYIIFERADGDIRKVLNISTGMDHAARLRALHHVATGLKQLHTMQIAHQDLKPSNVLVFSDIVPEVGRVSKVADLGRATDRALPTDHDDLDIAGDPTYAPPEQLYHATPLEFGARRLACDLYQLGSLTSFLFTATSVNALLSQQLPPQHSWFNWGGAYSDALPYVRDAFGRVVSRISSALPAELRDDLTAIIAYLCDPDPERRGHPVTRRQLHGNPYALTRIVTEFDRLAWRAELNVKRGLS